VSPVLLFIIAMKRVLRFPVIVIRSPGRLGFEGGSSSRSRTADVKHFGVCAAFEMVSHLHNPRNLLAMGSAFEEHCGVLLGSDERVRNPSENSGVRCVCFIFAGGIVLAFPWCH